MIVAAHQPNYLPNLAFFHKMKRADLFVIITNLQFEKHEGWQQRHKIPGPNGDIWLTVPVFGSQNQLIRDVKINNNLNWRRKHRRTLETVYAKAPAREFIPKLTSLYDESWDRLVDLNVAVIMRIHDLLDIETPVVVDERVSGVKHELLFNICNKYEADAYLSGIGVKLYLGPKHMREFKERDIKHRIVSKPLTAQYPYSTAHYVLEKGKGWILDVIA